MASGRGKTFKIGKMMINLSGRGIATKDTETGEIRRFPFPWAQSSTGREEPRRQQNQYEDEYDPNEEYEDEYDSRGYQQPEYDEETGEYYVPDDEYDDQEEGGLLAAPWLMWVALIVLPPLGIWLLWRYNRYEITPRSAISAASVIWFVVLLIWLFSGLNRGNDETVPPINLPTPSPTVEQSASPTPTVVPQATPIGNPDATGTQTPSTTDGAPMGGGATEEPTSPVWVWSKEGGKWYHTDQTCQGMTGANRISLSAAQNRSQTACPVCMPTTTEGGASATATPIPSGSYYATPVGTWYHSDPNCQGMTGAQVVTLDTALSRNQKPCPKCIGTVYITDKGSWYHSNSSCQGMKNAYLTTEENAASKGKTACPVCMGGSTTGGGSTGGGSTGSGSNGGGSTGSGGSYYYYTEGGTYYHKTANCSGMKGAIQGTAAAAEANGKSPCPTCLGGSSANANFWATTNGTYYHSKSDCSGMRNAARISEATAISRGKKPCPTCVGTGSGGETVPVVPGNGDSNGTVSNTDTTYYSTVDGTYFHKKQDCQGMKGATVVTVKEIEERHQVACPKCIGTSGTYYSTPTGSYYHSKSNCSGMKNATIVTLAMINSRGQSACPVCIGGGTDGESTGSVYYWATRNGAYYHSKSSCSGMSGASRVTAKEAEARGQEACPTCVGSVFATETGDYYHKNSSCQGMKDASRITIQAAERRGQTACPVCIGGGTASPTPTPKPGEDDDDSSLYYYSTSGGTYFHRTSTCSGMKGADRISEKTAISRGQSPCPKCIGSVYATSNGDYYHSKANCSGMKGASLVSVDTAELRGQSPCPVCMGGGSSNPTPTVRPTETPDVTARPTDRPTANPTDNTGNDNPGVDPDNTTVYCTLEGEKYHSEKHCSGMRNAASVTLSWALDHNYSRCTKCNAPSPR